MYNKYLLSVIALMALIGLGYSQPAVPFCCGGPTGWYSPDFYSCVFTCWDGCFVCDLADFGYSCQGYYGYQYSCSDDNDGGGGNDLDIDVSSTCDGNVVTVHDNGNPVDDADVTVTEYVSGDPVASGGVDSEGEFDFPGCPDNSQLKIKVDASASGYSDEIKIVTLMDCTQCAPPVCEDDEQLVDGECVPIPCECGEVVNKQCVKYTCDTGQACAACGEGQVCENKQCKEKEEFECTTDLQCDPDQFCNIPPGQNGGACKDLCEDGSDSCQCSQAVDHKLVPTGYECGFPGCPTCGTGTECIDHKCVAVDLSCPSTGIVGDEKTCSATDCPNCDVEVTGPDGKKSTGRTDENGNFDLPLNLEGIYKVLLLKDGQPVKTVEIKAFPQSQPEEPDKPTATGGDPFSLLWLLVLLLLVILGIVYWRSRQQKK